MDEDDLLLYGEAAYEINDSVKEDEKTPSELQKKEEEKEEEKEDFNDFDLYGNSNITESNDVQNSTQADSATKKEVTINQLNQDEQGLVLAGGFMNEQTEGLTLKEGQQDSNLKTLNQDLLQKQQDALKSLAKEEEHNEQLPSLDSLDSDSEESIDIILDCPEDNEDEENNNNNNNQQLVNVKVVVDSKMKQNEKGGGIDLNPEPVYDGDNLFDLNLDHFEDKPWKKPGADITDYFNYGFNDRTWALYTQRQQAMRLGGSKILVDVLANQVKSIYHNSNPGFNQNINNNDRDDPDNVNRQRPIINYNTDPNAMFHGNNFSLPNQNQLNSNQSNMNQNSNSRDDRNNNNNNNLSPIKNRGKYSDDDNYNNKNKDIRRRRSPSPNYKYSPNHRRSRSPNYKTNINSPGRHSRSPNYRRSLSKRRSRSPKRRSRTPLRRRSRSRSKSKIRNRSNSKVIKDRRYDKVKDTSKSRDLSIDSKRVEDKNKKDNGMNNNERNRKDNKNYRENSDLNYNNDRDRLSFTKSSENKNFDKERDNKRSTQGDRSSRKSPEYPNTSEKRSNRNDYDSKRRR